MFFFELNLRASQYELARFLLLRLSCPSINFLFFFPQPHSCLRLHKAFLKGSPKGYYFSSLQSLSVIISKISSYPKLLHAELKFLFANCKWKFNERKKVTFSVLESAAEQSEMFNYAKTKFVSALFP